MLLSKDVQDSTIQMDIVSVKHTKRLLPAGNFFLNHLSAIVCSTFRIRTNQQPLFTTDVSSELRQPLSSARSRLAPLALSTAPLARHRNIASAP